MSRSDQKTNFPRSLLRKLLASFSIDWIISLLELYPYVARLLSERYAGLYENLEYETTLELLDVKGEQAVFKKHQRIKFLQNNVLAFEDFAWGEGDIFAEYKIKPGVVVDRYQEGDRWNILISLRETKNSGDVEDFYINRSVKGGFTNEQEWKQVEIRHRTKHLRISVIFPKERRCQRATLVERSRHRTTPLDHEKHFHDLPDGRQKVTWETNDINRFEVFTLRWWW